MMDCIGLNDDLTFKLVKQQWPKIMSYITLERTLLYRGNDGQLTRYEIFKNDGNPADNIELVIVYREKEINEHKSWVRTNDEVSLEHLIPKQNTGFPTMVRESMSAGHGRQISYVIDECSKHWSQHYK